MTARWATQPNPTNPPTSAPGEEARRRGDLADPCEMPISPGVTCVLPGDHPHDDGCQPGPPRCKCSHARSLHGRGASQCYMAACGCASFREKAQP